MMTLFCFFFFFNDTATTEIYTLSLHDALPIFRHVPHLSRQRRDEVQRDARRRGLSRHPGEGRRRDRARAPRGGRARACRPRRLLRGGGPRGPGPARGPPGREGDRTAGGRPTPP